MMSNFYQKLRAFTLIELLVVVAIIALLVAILIPAVEEAKRQAKIVSCATRIHAYGQGLFMWSVDDPEGNYPPNPWWLHRIYSREKDSYFRDKGFPNSESFLRAYSERVTGGQGHILWCPLYSYWDTLMQQESRYFDPRWPGIMSTSWGWGAWMGGYNRFAAAEYPRPWHWVDSGNTKTDGPPTEPGQAQDVVLADMLMGDIGFPEFIDPHHQGNISGSDWLGNVSVVDFRISPYTENCVAYGDGHAETHRHSFDESLGWPYWDGHWVLVANQGLLY